jgi:hypothetical protein
MKFLLFFLEGFLFENFKYSVDLTNIAGFALTNILGVPRVLNIARSNILLLILFTTSIRGYVSFAGFSYRIIKRNKTTIVAFG